MTIREQIIELASNCVGQGGPEPWAKEAGMLLGPADKPAWCALFARTIWRRAGLSVPTWRVGEGNVSYLRKHGPGALVQPGDLGYVEKFGHNAIVVHDDGQTIRSIDGNVNGRVVNRLRPRSDYAAFYSIDPLLGDDAPTQPAPRVPNILSIAPVRSEDARRVQSALVARGFGLHVDGNAGPKTCQALLEWAWGELSQ
jgi:hypothetical protein